MHSKRNGVRNCGDWEFPETRTKTGKRKFRNFVYEPPYLRQVALFSRFAGGIRI